MSWLHKLPGFTRSAPGREWQLWRRLPAIAVVGTLLPLALVALAWLLAPAAASPAQDRALMQFAYLVVGVVVLHWTLVFTAGIGCIIVMLMKGPAYVADGYPMPESDRPAPELPPD
jgi:hypothetical protein